MGRLENLLDDSADFFGNKVTHVKVIVAGLLVALLCGGLGVMLGYKANKEHPQPDKSPGTSTPDTRSLQTPQKPIAVFTRR